MQAPNETKTEDDEKKTWSIKRRAILRLQKKGINARTIAYTLGASYAAVCNIIKDAGHQLSKTSMDDLSNAQKNQIVQMYKNGKSCVELSEIYMISPRVIAVYIKKVGGENAFYDEIAYGVKKLVYQDWQLGISMTAIAQKYQIQLKYVPYIIKEIWFDQD